MNLFESDNLWKRRERNKRMTSRPDTPQNRLDDARNKLTGDALWVVGAVVLDVLGLLGIKLGVVEVGVVTVVFLVILALYAVISLPGVRKDYAEYLECKKAVGK